MKKPKRDDDPSSSPEQEVAPPATTTGNDEDDVLFYISSSSGEGGDDEDDDEEVPPNTLRLVNILILNDFNKPVYTSINARSLWTHTNEPVNRREPLPHTLYEYVWVYELECVKRMYAPAKWVWVCSHCGWRWVGDKVGPCKGREYGCHGAYICCYNCMTDIKYCEDPCVCKNSGEHEARLHGEYEKKEKIELLDSSFQETLLTHCNNGLSLLRKAHLSIEEQRVFLKSAVKDIRHLSLDLETELYKLRQNTDDIDKELATIRFKLANTLSTLDE